MGGRPDHGFGRNGSRACRAAAEADHPCHLPLAAAILEFEVRAQPDGGTLLAWAFLGPASLRLRILDVVRLLGRQVRAEMSHNLAGLRGALEQPAAAATQSTP
jgi:hypothetical protein